MKKYELIIFDFDDTIGHLTVRWDKVKEEIIEYANNNGEKFDPATHVIYIANDVSESEEGKKKVVEIFRKYESKCVEEKTYLMFPSMVELLRDLKEAGYRIAIGTGNNVKTVSGILEAVGLSDLVELIIGIDSVRFAKPDPETLAQILKKLGIEKENALFIGNSDFDVMTGKAAGVETIKITTLWEQLKVGNFQNSPGLRSGEDDVVMLRKRLLD
jgi:HAD superfamily hydrolase (TIGR01549 family)